MDWDLAIARNLASLRRIAESLLVMAGLGADAAPANALRAPWPATLPRHLHAAVLSVLRPAESALRRLIVIAARDLVVALPPAARARLADVRLAAQTSPTGIFLNGRPAHPDDLARLRSPGMAASQSGGAAAEAMDARPRAPSFALLDPLKRFGQCRQGPSQFIPRIRFDLDLDLDAPPAPPAPMASPEDPVGAARLCRRLAALKKALDDLPGQARRLARWRARRLARPRGRLSPLRPGAPPGHRKLPTHPVDELLQRCHGLAIDAGARRDSS